jgi:beta-phosphoglucomutase-like phosphatase (HAD superfamily)
LHGRYIQSANKNSPEIYVHTLEKLNLAATQAIFVDDRKVNTDAAEACGIPSLVFTDTSTFSNELENLLSLKSKQRIAKLRSNDLTIG